MKRLNKKWFFLSLLAVVVATLVFLPSLVAVDNGNDMNVAEKRALLKSNMDAMRAEIEANGWTFTVDYNPAMQYSIEQLCTFNPNIQGSLAHASQPLNELSGTMSLPTYYVSPYVTPIKNQGSCGSCWAFGGVAAFESAIYKTDGVVVDLSEQYVVSCNPDGWSCSGGWWAYEMMMDPGMILESCFPYVAQDVPCSYSCGYSYISNGYGFCESENAVASVDSIKNAIYAYGSVNAAIMVDSYFQAYSSGVMNSCKRNPRWVNHMINLVGWDDSNSAWRLKNSWGTGWGEDGFMWIAYNCNLVGYGASYVIY